MPAGPSFAAGGFAASAPPLMSAAASSSWPMYGMPAATAGEGLPSSASAWELPPTGQLHASAPPLSAHSETSPLAPWQSAAAASFAQAVLSRGPSTQDGSDIQAVGGMKRGRHESYSAMPPRRAMIVDDLVEDAADDGSAGHSASAPASHAETEAGGAASSVPSSFASDLHAAIDSHAGTSGRSDAADGLAELALESVAKRARL